MHARTVAAPRAPALLWLALTAGLAMLGCDSARTSEAREVTASGASHARYAVRSDTDTVAFWAAGDGPVPAVVREALSRAWSQNRKLVVYVGAAWCEPCQRFHRAVLARALDRTFPGLTLLEFDLDRDGDRLAEAGYKSAYIPLFALPKTDGTSSGQQIEGSIKGEGAVDQITPRLRELLAR